ncbi:MAG: methyltransferase domain-containing protein [Treponema sp.]|jgi:2-polyprenyl-3-methyl-5-hydroxy-6-metoxy-1,4-benzoquinol methylase/spore coat polysaccharide biosynthesis predicted glycosyltransferase SpsG|nr:methyltransferase domain-containing protein [Treponema sp.]
MSGGPVLAVPSCGPGRGGGHLVRMSALTRDLRALGREAWLFLPPDSGGLNVVLGTAHFDRAWITAETGLRDWDFIVLDRFQTPPEEFTRWAELAPLVGIDEGGPCRKQFDFLIDILPGLPGGAGPNIAGASLLPLPEKKQQDAAHTGRKQSPLKVLIGFGQEDAAGLGPASARALAGKNVNGLLDITLLSGGLDRQDRMTPNIPHRLRIAQAIPQLGNHLGEYDLLITHYGITAFEALYAGTPVLLLSPTAYHEKLAKAAGFSSAGTGPEKAAKLPRLLLTAGALNDTFIDNLRKNCAVLAVRHNVDREPKQSLAELLDGFVPFVSRACPVCGSAVPAGIIFRYTERSYRRCKRCGAIVMNRRNPPPIEYEREYFFGLYQKQYGKTYIEDFPHLIAAGKRRLGHIKRLLPAAPGGKPRLLDIGCAYGPFLAAARAEGFAPAGIDPAGDAIRYVTQTLGIPAVRGFFPGGPIPGSGSPPPLFDAVTLWFVIEHFRDCVPVFAEIKKTLAPGGVLAFSTPSFSGISGRQNLESFLEKSPADHWTVWSPAVCKKALGLAGFRVKKTVISGHHPERFPLLGRFAKTKKSPLYGLLLAVSILFSLGDTFEVYASAE